MRSKLCEDGVNRIIAKVVVPMGAKEITLFALSNPRFFDDAEAMNTFQNLNKRQLFNVAKESVAFRGNSLSSAQDIVQEVWSQQQINRARDHVARLFPEVD
jgi:hypothetical protein